MNKTVLEELSGDLPEHEREDLLYKIKQSITSTNVTDPASISEAHSERERFALIQQELKALSFFQKFYIWFISRMSGKKREDVFASRKVQALKHVISRKAPGITGFETRNITPVMAETIFDLYKSVLPVRAYFQNLWIKEGCFERVLIFLLNQKIHEPKESLEAIITMDEMVEIYGRLGGQGGIKDEVLKRLNDYITSIPLQDFLDAETYLSPFYYLKDLVLFPFASFFQLFRFNPIAMPEVKEPFFKNASAMLTLGYLEKLYVAGEIAKSIKDPLKIDTALMEYLLILGEENREVVEKEKDEEDQDEPELIREERLKHHIRWIQDIYRKTMKINRNMPLLELLQFFHKDPYFQLGHDTPELHFKEFYYLILKRLILSQLEAKKNEIQQLYIQQEIEALFKGKRLIALQNYRDYSSIDYNKLGLPFFVHTKSINLLYNFVHHYYREYYYDVFQLLERNILAQNRLTRDRLEKHSSSFEEIANRIKDFDYSLSPDSEDGKMFQKLRFSLATDVTLQKMYRSIVIHKDREVKLLLERGEEDIMGLIKLMDELLSSPADLMKIQLGTHYLVRGRSALLKNLLITRRDHLRKFWNLISQIIKMERD